MNNYKISTDINVKLNFPCLQEIIDSVLLNKWLNSQELVEANRKLQKTNEEHYFLASLHLDVNSINKNSVDLFITINTLPKEKLIND